MVLRGKNATLVVIGDIGRSPRMCYHARSLADKNYRVQIVGYTDSAIHQSIQHHPYISVVSLRCPPEYICKLRPIFALILKFLWTLTVLLLTLFFRIDWPLLIMVQNPPGLPSLLACWLCARIRRAQFIIDWHNYTYSVLRKKYNIDEIRVSRASERRIQNSLNCSDDHSLVVNDVSGMRGKRMTRVERAVQAAAVAANKRKRQADRKKRCSIVQRCVEQIYYWEGYFGRCADLNICVTHAMRQDMFDAWDISAATVYDRPPAWSFRKLTDEERHKFLLKLIDYGGEFEVFKAVNNPCLQIDCISMEETLISYRDNEGKVQLRNDRPLLLVSSTSWTEDEDFGLLLDALREFDNIAKLSSRTNPATRLPFITCIITGRGPLRSYYLGRIEHMQMQNVEILTPWLKAEDYPFLIGCADIGVSLHTSTSGLDLPMKVVDMLGCGLPVIAKRFGCIGELISDGHNGRLFDTSHELSHIIKTLSCGFPVHCSQLNTLTLNVHSNPLISWNKNWDACLWPLLNSYGALSVEDLARRQRFAVISLQNWPETAEIHDIAELKQQKNDEHENVRLEDTADDCGIDCLQKAISRN
ncbi:glycosyl transferase, group 1 family protein [Brugia malayi]|uniref:Bm6016 n=1 Tax=Brugia malayi TaxID=6279 RepID=A0A0J9Y1A0_BRUMA|nr:glycosyl transferase, group 1 family protein [Brugia malayi]CDP99681.2 Bm6016 [Brugia malayi]VIO91848.1 glycosyl transferase, group 1 family protein [Brugia malayi]